MCKNNFNLLWTLLNQHLNYDIRVLLTPLTLPPLRDQFSFSVFLFQTLFSSPSCFLVSRSRRPASCLSPNPPWMAKTNYLTRSRKIPTHNLAVCWIASLQDRVLCSLLPIDLLLRDKLIPFLQKVEDNPLLYHSRTSKLKSYLEFVDSTPSSPWFVWHVLHISDILWMC